MNTYNIDVKKILMSTEEDRKILEALKLTAEQGAASVSLFRRELRVGDDRAKRIINKLQDLGIIEEHQGSKSRSLLMKIEELQQVIRAISSAELVPIEEIKYHENHDDLKTELSENENSNNNIMEENHFLKIKMHQLNSQLIIEKQEHDILKSRYKELLEEISEMKLYKEKYIDLKEEYKSLAFHFQELKEFNNFNLAPTRSQLEVETEYSQKLRRDILDNKELMEQLFDRGVIENLQSQYEHQYDKLIGELFRLEKIIGQQHTSFSLFNLNHFELARDITISTRDFISFLEEVSLRNKKGISSDENIHYVNSSMVKEILEIVEAALNELTPLCGKEIEKLEAINVRVQRTITKFFINLQKVFINRGLVPPKNSVLDELDKLPRVWNEYAFGVRDLVLYFYLAMVQINIGEYTESDTVGIDYFIKKNRDQVEQGFANMDEATKRFCPNIESYVRYKLFIYSKNGKLPKELFLNRYAQNHLCILNRHTVENFVYDESILETINDKTVFYISGCQQTGIYKFGVTFRSAAIRLEGNSKIAYSKLGVSDFKLLKEISTVHAQTIEDYFKEKFTEQSSKLGYKESKEWVLLETEEEVHYMLEGIWETDERLQYIFSYSLE